MSGSIVVRIPKKDYREIRKIQNKLNINFNSAFSIWKKQKLGIKWEDF